MFKFPKKMFIELSTSVVNVCKHPQCVSLSNQKCTTQPILVNLHPNEYSQGLQHYPFYVN